MSRLFNRRATEKTYVVRIVLALRLVQTLVVINRLAGRRTCTTVLIIEVLRLARQLIVNSHSKGIGSPIVIS